MNLKHKNKKVNKENSYATRTWISIFDVFSSFYVPERIYLIFFKYLFCDLDELVSSDGKGK